MELIANSVDLLERITPARVRHELELIFAEARPEHALRRLDQFGVVQYMHPDLRLDDWVTFRFERLRAALRLAHRRPPTSTSSTSPSGPTRCRVLRSRFSTGGST